MMLPLVRAITLCLSLAACAGGGLGSVAKTGEFGFQGTAYDRDTAVYYISGRNEIIIPDINTNLYSLEIWKDTKTNEYDYRVTISVIYEGDWRRYSSARKKGGDSLRFVESDRDVVTCGGYGECSLSEVFVVFLPKRDFLNGVSFQVNAPGHRFIFQIPKDKAARVQQMADEKF